MKPIIRTNSKRYFTFLYVITKKKFTGKELSEFLEKLGYHFQRKQAQEYIALLRREYGLYIEAQTIGRENGIPQTYIYYPEYSRYSIYCPDLKKKQENDIKSFISYLKRDINHQACEPEHYFYYNKKNTESYKIHNESKIPQTPHSISQIKKKYTQPLSNSESTYTSTTKYISSKEETKSIPIKNNITQKKPTPSYTSTFNLLIIVLFISLTTMIISIINSIVISQI